MTSLRPVPMTYRGVRFRSTLEADWAATLDQLGITWQYEPEAVQLPSGALYRPDFYLPEITTWFEVKGPGVPGAEKATELAHAVTCPEPVCLDECGCWWYPAVTVVIGLAPIPAPTMQTSYLHHGYATWAGQDVVLALCRECDHSFWLDTTLSYRCRHCGAHDGDHHLNGWDESGVIPFVRAPRPGKAA